MKHTEEYWNERWQNPKYGPETPERVKNAIKRIWSVYPDDCLPQGTSDPMYIMNVIAYEFGIGDGQGNFELPEMEK